MWVNSSYCFFFLFYLIFFYLILLHWVDWKLRLIIYFLFTFHGVIMVLWFRSRVKPVDLGFFVLFLDEFFFQYWVVWELSFIIYFNLCYMRFSWPGSRVYSVNSGGFLCSYFNWFFYFTLQHWIDCELSFITYFNLFFIRLSCSHNLGLTD